MFQWNPDGLWPLMSNFQRHFAILGIIDLNCNRFNALQAEKSALLDSGVTGAPRDAVLLEIGENGRLQILGDR